MATRRRDLLIAAGAVGLVVAAPKLWRGLDRGFSFETIDAVPGFRRIAAGAVSGAGFVLAGVEPPTALERGLRQQVRDRPCQTVFGITDWPGDRLPVAVFTDYNCPYCPTISTMVSDLLNDDAPVRVTWHDLPVLGPRSDAAARAALAAAAQERYLPVHQRLMRSVMRPGDAQLIRLAREFDLDEVRFLRDVDSPGTDLRLAQTQAIAAVFGIVGTPAIIVGRTLVVGEIDMDRLKDLIRLERETPFQGCS